MTTSASDVFLRGDVRYRAQAQFPQFSCGRPYLRKLIEVMLHLRDSGLQGGVFAFTSPEPKTGVSHVLRLIAEELAYHTGELVLLAESCTLDGLSSPQPGRPSRGALELAPNVWNLVSTHHLDPRAASDLERIVIDVLSRRFGFIMIDCPALTRSADALLVASQTDGVFLVVAAGETRRDQIRRARKLLREASGNVAGLILNKRTYAVPRPISKLFK